MKRRDKKEGQGLKNVDDNTTEQKRKDEFKIEIIKVGRLVQNTEQDNYDGPPPDFPPPSLPPV